MTRRIPHCLCLLLLFVATQAAAWGERGHRLVGALAEQQLSAPARAEAAALLAGEPEPSLAGIATWADAIREQPGGAWSAPLHYVHIRDRGCRYAARRDCADSACVVGAIERYAARLADRTLPRTQRAEALKFVVHFVADVHQPLHSGWRPDKGGNEFQLSVRSREAPPQGANLHRVWDHFILAQAAEAFDPHARRLRFAQWLDAGTSFTAAEAARWAETSCALTNAEGFYPRRPGRLPDGYLERMRPLAEQRLREAAAELAVLLEGALGAR